MESPLLRRVCREAGVPDLLERLSERISPSDLQSLLPVGSNSQLGGIDQNNVLATVRGTEVVADPTVPLALEATRRRRDGVDVARMCATHRVLRQQPFEPPAAQHVLPFAMVTGGRTRPDHASEVGALVEHVRAHLAIVAAARELGAPIEQAVVRVSDTVVHTAAMESGAALTADVSTPREALSADIARRLGRRLRRV
jgi:hypothetical protein